MKSIRFTGERGLPVDEINNAIADSAHKVKNLIQLYNSEQEGCGQDSLLSLFFLLSQNSKEDKSLYKDEE